MENYLEKMVQSQNNLNNVELDFFEKQNEVYTTGEIFERAFKNNTLSYSLYQTGVDYLQDDKGVDNEFTKEKAQQLFLESKKDIHPRFIDWIVDNSKSEKDFYDKLTYMEEETKKQNQLENMGFMKNAGVNFMASALDLPILLGMTATAEFAVPAIASATAGSVVARGMLGATNEIALTAVNDYLGEEDKTAIDYGMGALFGASMNALLGGNTMMKRTLEKTMESQIDAKGLATKLSKAKTDEEKSIITQNHFKELGLGENKSFQKNMEMLRKRGETNSISKNLHDKFRVDLAFLTSKSKSVTMQKLSDDWFIDSTLQGNALDKRSNIEIASSIEDSIQSKTEAEFSPIIKQFAREVYGKNAITSRYSGASDIISNIAGEMQVLRDIYTVEKPKEYFIGVSSAKLREAGASEELANELSEKIFLANSKSVEHAYNILKQNGKKGFVDESIPRSSTYSPFIYNRHTKDMFTEKGLKFRHFQDMMFNSLVSRAKKDGRNLSDESIENMRVASIGLAKELWSDKNASLYAGRSIDSIFKEVINTEGVDESVKNMFYKSTKADERADKTSAVFSRTRTGFDYTYRYSTSVDGKLVEVGFDDLINKNFLGTMTQYSKKMGGNTALEKSLVKRNLMEKNKYLFDSVKYNFSNITKLTKQKENLLLSGKTLSASDENLLEKSIKDFNENSKKLSDIFGENTNDILTKISNIDDLRERVKTKQEVGVPVRQLELDEIAELSKELDELTIKEIDLSTANNVRMARDWIEDDLIKAGASGKEIKSELTKFDQIVKELSGMPTAEDSFGTPAQIQRILSNMNMARLLGQTGMTMTAELGSVVWETGVKNFLEFSSMGKLMKQLRTGELTDELSQEIQTYMGLGRELNKQISGNIYDHEFDLSSLKTSVGKDKMLNKIESVSEKLADATMMVGGLKPLTAWLEDITAKNVINKILKMSQKKEFSMADTKWMNEVGISDVMAKKIFNQINKYGTFEAKKWSNGNKVHTLGFEKWDDDDVKNIFVNGVRRFTNTTIQKSYLGDKIGFSFGDNLFKNKILGRIALELKDYMITSYVKQLGRALGRSDAYAIGMMATQIGFLTTGVVLQNYMNYAGRPDKLEEMMQPEKIARTVFSKLPVSSTIPMLVDTATGLTTGEKIFGDSRFQSGTQNALMSMPMVDLLMKAEKVLSFPARAVINQDVKESDISAMFGITPLGNTYGVRTVQEIIKEAVKD